MIYSNWVLSGRGVKGKVYSGDEAYDTIVRNSASLQVNAGGYIERTHILNNATASNAGSAVDTYLSGGVMQLLKGGVATNVQVLRNARLSVSSGAVATGVTVVSGGGGNVNTTVYGNDSVTRIEGTNELGSFYLSNGVASNFLLHSLGMLTVSSGGTALDTEIRINGALTVSNGGVATGIVMGKGGKLNTTVRGGDAQTLVSGTHDSGTFLLSGGVATDFILYENATQYVSNGGIALHTLISSTWAHQFISSGGLASLTSVCAKGSMTVYGGGVARDTVVLSGGSMMAAGGHISGATVSGLLQVTTATTGPDESGGSSVLENIFVVSGGTLDIAANAKYSGTVDISGGLKISGGLTVNNLTVSSGGSAVVAGTFNVTGSTWNTTVNSGGRMNVSSGGEGRGVTVSGGGLLAVSAGGSAADVDQQADGRINVTVRGGDTETLLFGTNESGSFRLSGGSASGFIVYFGAELTVSNGGVVTDAEIRRGGRMNIAPGAEIGGRVLLDFSGAPILGGGLINDLALVSSDARIVLAGASAAGSYILADSGSTEAVIRCMPTELYDNAVAAGESYTNAFTGRTYDFDATGKTITVTEFTAATQATAGSIESGATINGNGKAAKWTSTTTATGTIKAATSNISGDAWLEIDGTDMGGTTLFGADTGFAGEVNLYATGDATIGNLAAGAVSSGSVAGVKLTLDSATVGLAYAGGFGTVTGKTETLIGSGATMTKDFYAGALANYAKTNTATSAGNIKLEIADGEFSGNIYGAASVKAGGATTLVHSVGDVTINVKGGATTKGNQACLFAGGYATGTAASENAVYTVGNIDTTIDGGSWGAVAGGRGVFGGIFASKVTAEARDVSITINGGTFGNVYGGGWSQKGGASIVDSVEITIAGGTIANIFGGGTHSNGEGSGDSTTQVTGNVSINVSGGTITGDIYARGQSAADTVNGNVSVNFTGDRNFDCGVWGFSYVGGAASDAALSFCAYTGTFSGAIGGFVGITLDDDTAMTLGTAAADVSNTAWTFDFTDRADTLAGTSFLTWDSADFAGDTVRVNFTDATQAAAGWSIATAAFDATTTFTLAINDVDVTSVAYDTAIADGDWAGWKFTSVDGTLKFKELA